MQKTYEKTIFFFRREYVFMYILVVFVLLKYKNTNNFIKSIIIEKERVRHKESKRKTKKVKERQRKREEHKEKKYETKK